MWRGQVGLGRGGVRDEVIRTDAELRAEDVDSFFSVVNRRSGRAFLGGRRIVVITINLGTCVLISKQLFIFPILFNSCCNLVK